MGEKTDNCWAIWICNFIGAISNELVCGHAFRPQTSNILCIYTHTMLAVSTINVQHKRHHNASAPQYFTVALIASRICSRQQIRAVAPIPKQGNIKLAGNPLPCSLWACRMVHKQEEKGCPGRRPSRQALLTGTDRFQQVWSHQLPDY
jgi:hypothetical protein